MDLINQITPNTDKIDISSLSFDYLTEFIKNLGEPSYKAEQIFKAISKNIPIEDMLQLSTVLREKIAEKAFCTAIFEEQKLIDPDGTIKYLFRLEDGSLIESVLMNYKHGNSLCISSQVGCRMGCGFCASTIKGLSRNLTAGEMLAQVAYANKERSVSHIVIMGVGEPLDNFDNLTLFIDNVKHPKGLNISARHISVSTCGLVDKIDMLAEKKLQITLSVSLHAPDNITRDIIMPINKKYPVEQLIASCERYIKATGRRISFEYTLIKGVNDSTLHAQKLAKLLKGILCHVNLIPVNFVEERGFLPSSHKQLSLFYNILLKYGINATVRRTLGSSINASCGQLRHKNL